MCEFCEYSEWTIYFIGIVLGITVSITFRVFEEIIGIIVSMLKDSSHKKNNQNK